MHLSIQSSKFCLQHISVSLLLLVCLLLKWLICWALHWVFSFMSMRNYCSGTTRVKSHGSRHTQGAEMLKFKIYNHLCFVKTARGALLIVFTLSIICEDILLFANVFSLIMICDKIIQGMSGMCFFNSRYDCMYFKDTYSVWVCI